MNVASLELSKELYELSGWETDQTWAANGSGLEFIVRSDDGELGHDIYLLSYAYDLGYLLRKLPQDNETMVGYWKNGWKAVYVSASGSDWRATIRSYAEGSDTPENAACKLAIELFKAGVLTKAD